MSKTTIILTILISIVLIWVAIMLLSLTVIRQDQEIEELREMIPEKHYPIIGEKCGDWCFKYIFTDQELYDRVIEEVRKDPSFKEEPLTQEESCIRMNCEDGSEAIDARCLGLRCLKCLDGSRSYLYDRDLPVCRPLTKEED